MKVYSLTALISFPFVVCAFYFGYMTFVIDNPDTFIYFFASILISIGLYVFQPQIDFLWYSKHPQRLHDKEQEILTLTSSYYNSLDEEQKVLFEERIFVFMRAKDFKWIRDEQKDLPLDMKLIISANAIQLTMFKEDYLYGKYDNYFAYNHPFPTPDKQFLHSVEVNYEDKMAVFNIEYLMHAQNVKNKVFNIGLFAFAEIFLDLNPNITFSTIDNNQFWLDMESISGIKKKSLMSYIGYEPDSLYAVMITIFFMYRKEYEQLLPKSYTELSNVFLKK